MTANQGPLAHHFDDLEQQRDAVTMGMWVFLVTEVMFFGALFTAYFVYRDQYRDGFAAGREHLDVVMGTVNTLVLLTSSLTMALAVRASQIGRRQALLGWLGATMVLGSAFLAIKFMEYAHKIEEGLVPFSSMTERAGNASPDGSALFINLYYVMTGLHALHMVIGIAIMAILVLLAWRGRYTDGNYVPIELTGLYWHFVDVVWIFLFPCVYLIDRS